MLLLLLLNFTICFPQGRRCFHVAIGRKRLIDSHMSRASMIRIGKLGAIGAGGALILELCSHGRCMLLPHCHALRGLCRNVEATRSAVVTHMRVVPVPIVIDRTVIDVMHNCDVDVVDRAVVVEVASAPVTTLVAVAAVAKTVVDAAIVANVLAPVAGVISVRVIPVAPVAGCPECALVRSLNPCAGNPVVAVWRPRPVAGRPEIVIAGVLRLVVVHQRRRRLL